LNRSTTSLYVGSSTVTSSNSDAVRVVSCRVVSCVVGGGECVQ
jgi:hypothetical protein